jgi:Domain of unknown function (DUF4395)
MSKIFQFGETVPGYSIPVLNEREIRAGAGILFLATFYSLMVIMFRENFVPVKYVITVFFTDFLIRVFISPRYSPVLILSRWIVRNQNPEYVGAKQKKFAWVIGVILSGTMFIFFNIVNAFSPITGIICLICLIFLFFESAFGICIGCKMYSLMYKEKAQYCPGEICERKDRQPIQKVSGVQYGILFLFAGYIVLVVFLANDHFAKKPYDLFGMFEKAQPK